MFARRFMPAVLLAAKKTTTGLVGLEVVPDARRKLIEIYQRTLFVLEMIPETAQYRKTVDKFTRFRLQVCQEEEEEDRIEERIGCGQVEQLLEQADLELKLIPKMAEWKPWEAPPGHKVTIVDNGLDPPSHIPRHKSSFDPEAKVNMWPTPAEATAAAEKRAAEAAKRAAEVTAAPT